MEHPAYQTLGLCFLLIVLLRVLLNKSWTTQVPIALMGFAVVSFLGLTFIEGSGLLYLLAGCVPFVLFSLHDQEGTVTPLQLVIVLSAFAGLLTSYWMLGREPVYLHFYPACMSLVAVGLLKTWLPELSEQGGKPSIKLLQVVGLLLATTGFMSVWIPGHGEKSFWALLLSYLSLGYCSAEIRRPNS